MLTDNVAQECEALLAEFTLLWVQHCTGFLDLQKGCMKTRIMLLLVLAKDEDVIHVAKYTFLPCKNLVHSSLKVLRGTLNAKGLFVEAVVPERGDEGGEGPGLLIDGDLPESAVSI